MAFHHFLNERMVGMDTEQFFRLQNDFTVDMFVGGIEQFDTSMPSAGSEVEGIPHCILASQK